MRIKNYKDLCYKVPLFEFGRKEKVSSCYTLDLNTEKKKAMAKVNGNGCNVKSVLHVIQCDKVAVR